MIARRSMTESREVQKRAAEIRRHWSPLEKARRTGLPPDIPARLRHFILGDNEVDWSMAACIPLRQEQTQR